jgi:hypothetical protein
LNVNWQLLGLLNKAIYAIQRAEFAESHVLSWSITESLLGQEWESYIKSTNQMLERGAKTVNSERLSNLMGAAYTAAIRAEVLELVKVIPHVLYKRSIKARKVRNDWLHYLSPVSQEDCIECYEVARDLLSRKLGFELKHPAKLYISDEFLRNIK